MARSAETNASIGRKISKLKGEGYGQRQATAIAMRMHRDGEIRPARKRMSRTQRERTRRPSRKRR